MATFREVAYELAQAGQWELAMTAWTRENLRQINRGLRTEPVIDENLRQAGLWLSQKPKDGFSSFDEQILEYLLQLQKEIGNHSNLQPSIDILLNEWRTSPNQNLYDWTLQTIRTTKGPEDRVLILAALGKFLEEQVDQFARQYDLQHTLRDAASPENQHLREAESEEKIAELFHNESTLVKSVQGTIMAARKLLYENFVRKNWKPCDFNNYAYQKMQNNEKEEAIFWWTIAAAQGDTSAKRNLYVCEQQGLLPKGEPVHYRVKPIEGEFIPKEQESDLKRAAKQLLSDIDERIAREQQYSASFRGFKSR